jgi:hypothetical protein
VSVHWSGYDATALDMEVDPQRCRFQYPLNRSGYAPEAACEGEKIHDDSRETYYEGERLFIGTVFSSL